jgi:hypothetical protein
MREISLERLRTLVAISDRGSFVDAARALHLRQQRSASASLNSKSASGLRSCRASVDMFGHRLGIAHRPGHVERSTQYVLAALWGRRLT